MTYDGSDTANDDTANDDTANDDTANDDTANDDTANDENAVAAEVRRVRAEYAEEEAEAAEIEAAENAGALDVPFSLRLTRDLDARLRERAAAEDVPPSALMRRILRDALHGAPAPVLTVEQVEQIARRVVRESA